MGLLLLEALLALAVLLLIVWWTMFSGRQKGELPPAHSDVSENEAKVPLSAETPPSQKNRPS